MGGELLFFYLKYYFYYYWRALIKKIYYQLSRFLVIFFASFFRFFFNILPFVYFVCCRSYIFFLWHHKKRAAKLQTEVSFEYFKRIAFFGKQRLLVPQYFGFMSSPFLVNNRINSFHFVYLGTRPELFIYLFGFLSFIVLKPPGWLYHSRIRNFLTLNYVFDCFQRIMAQGFYAFFFNKFIPVSLLYYFVKVPFIVFYSKQIIEGSFDKIVFFFECFLWLKNFLFFYPDCGKGKGVVSGKASVTNFFNFYCVFYKLRTGFLVQKLWKSFFFLGTHQVLLYFFYSFSFVRKFYFNFTSLTGFCVSLFLYYYFVNLYLFKAKYFLLFSSFNLFFFDNFFLMNYVRIKFFFLVFFSHTFWRGVKFQMGNFYVNHYFFSLFLFVRRDTPFYLFPFYFFYYRLKFILSFFLRFFSKFFESVLLLRCDVSLEVFKFFSQNALFIQFCQYFISYFFLIYDSLSLLCWHAFYFCSLLRRCCYSYLPRGLSLIMFTNRHFNYEYCPESFVSLIYGRLDPLIYFFFENCFFYSRKLASLVILSARFGLMQFIFSYFRLVRFRWRRTKYHSSVFIFLYYLTFLVNNWLNKSQMILFGFNASYATLTLVRFFLLSYLERLNIFLRTEHRHAVNFRVIYGGVLGSYRKFTKKIYYNNFSNFLGYSEIFKFSRLFGRILKNVFEDVPSVYFKESIFHQKSFFKFIKFFWQFWCMGYSLFVNNFCAFVRKRDRFLFFRVARYEKYLLNLRRLNIEAPIRSFLLFHFFYYFTAVTYLKYGTLLLSRRSRKGNDNLFWNFSILNEQFYIGRHLKNLVLYTLFYLPFLFMRFFSYQFIFKSLKTLLYFLYPFWFLPKLVLYLFCCAEKKRKLIYLRVVLCRFVRFRRLADFLYYYLYFFVHDSLSPRFCVYSLFPNILYYYFKGSTFSRKFFLNLEFFRPFDVVRFTSNVVKSKAVVFFLREYPRYPRAETERVVVNCLLTAERFNKRNKRLRIFRNLFIRNVFYYYYTINLFFFEKMKYNHFFCLFFHFHARLLNIFLYQYWFFFISYLYRVLQYFLKWKFQLYIDLVLVNFKRS